MSGSDLQQTTTDTKSNADSWFGVKDAQARKKIQNRIAQRARRQRLANSKPSSKVTALGLRGRSPVKLAPKIGQPFPTEKGDVLSDTTRIGPSSIIENSLLAPEVPTQESQAMLPYTKQRTPLIMSPPSYHPGTDPFFLNMPNFTLLAAIYSNGHILGLSCVIPVPRQLVPVPVEIPPSLRPFTLQKEVPHAPYIDCIPIPKLRENLILLDGLIDNSSFCGEMISSSAFVVTGSQSWDPNGWIISPAFKEKWAFLFI